MVCCLLQCAFVFCFCICSICASETQEWCEICSIVATKEQQHVHMSWKRLLMLWVIFLFFSCGKCDILRFACQTNPGTVFQVLYANEVLEERFDPISHFCAKENKPCSSSTLCKWLEQREYFFCTKENKPCSSTTLCKWLGQHKYFFPAKENKPCSSTTLCKWFEQHEYFFCAKENKPCSSTTLCKWSTWRMSWPNFMFFVTTCEQFRT